MPLQETGDPRLVTIEINEASYPSLKDRAVLITGGGSGIGMYLVEAFCRQGAKVGFIDINADAAARVVEVVAAETGNEPAFVHCDLTDIEAMRLAIEQLRQVTGPFSIVVNNAANDDRLPVEDVTPEYWDDRMNTNLRHQFFATQACVADMAELGGGSVINMGSITWMIGDTDFICYSTAKSAIQGLTRSLARELGDRNIRVNSIAPGWTLTERQLDHAKKMSPEKFAKFRDRQCLKESLLPPDIARMALWLAADDSRLVTGQTFVVDGGVV